MILQYTRLSSVYDEFPDKTESLRSLFNHNNNNNNDKNIKFEKLYNQDEDIIVYQPTTSKQHNSTSNPDTTPIKNITKISPTASSTKQRQHNYEQVTNSKSHWLPPSFSFPNEQIKSLKKAQWSLYNTTITTTTPKSTKINPTNTNKSICNPPHRWFHAACVIFGRLHIVGGKEDTPCNTVMIFDFETKEWSEPKVKGMSPPPFYSAGYCTIGKSLYINGGMTTINGVCDILDTTYRFDTVTHRWHQLSTKGPHHRRYRHCLCPIDDTHLLSLWGRSEGHFAPLSILNLNNNTWVDIEPSYGSGDHLTKPRPRAGHAAAVLNGCLWVFGGVTQDYLFPQHIDVLNLKTMSWQALHWDRVPLSGEWPCPRWIHCWEAVNDTTLLLFGGYDGNRDLNDVWTFNIHSYRWTKQRVSGPPGVSGHSMTSAKDDIHAVLYGGLGKERCSSVWVLRIPQSSHFQADTTSMFDQVNS